VSLVINTTSLVRIRYEYSYQEVGFYRAISKEQYERLKRHDINSCFVHSCCERVSEGMITQSR
jgi:hypothetical protein